MREKMHRVVKKLKGAKRSRPALQAAIEPLEIRRLLSVTVTTGSATGVTPTAAVISGAVNPGGTTATTEFQYSTDPTFPATVPSTVGSGLYGPEGLATDAAGDVFVAEGEANEVEKISPTGVVTKVGSGLADPQSVAVDSAGDVYVADSANDEVEKVLPNGGTQRVSTGVTSPILIAIDPAGDLFVNGYASDSVTEILANGSSKTITVTDTAPYVLIRALATDAAGDLFVVDENSSSIDEILSDGTRKSVGSGFNSPDGVAVDASGDVFVADSLNHDVKEVLPDGTIEVLQSVSYNPYDLTVDPAGEVFLSVLDATSLERLSPVAVSAAPASVNGSSASTVSATLTGLAPGTTYYYRTYAVDSGAEAVGSTGSFTTPFPPPVVTTGSASAITPTGATVAGAVNPDGTTATTEFQYSTNPSFPNTTQSNVSSTSTFDNPDGLALDAAGDIFVADVLNKAVKEILPGGTTNTLGSGFSYPQGVAVDSEGDVFVADAGNNAVKEIPAGQTTPITIGSGFYNPTAVAVDAAGDVFVADSGNNAIKEIAGGKTTPITLGSGFSNPHGVAVDAAGDVFVSDYGNNAVKEIAAETTVPITLATGFKNPYNIAVDAAGDVFVADSGDGLVKEILPGGAVQTLGSGFSKPQGVAVDSAGDVFVADGSKTGIVELSPPTAGATPATVNSSSASPVSAVLTGLRPGTTYFYRVVADSVGGQVVGSTGSFTTLPPPVVTTGSAFGITPTGATVAGTVNPEGTTATTEFQYSTDPTFPATVQSTVGSGLTNPQNLATDASGNVFVADGGNNAVKKISPTGAITTIGSGF